MMPDADSALLRILPKKAKARSVAPPPEACSTPQGRGIDAAPKAPASPGPALMDSWPKPSLERPGPAPCSPEVRVESVLPTKPKAMPKPMPKMRPETFVLGDLVLVWQTFKADHPELELLKGWTGKVSEVFEGGMLRIQVDQLADCESSEVCVDASNVFRLLRRAALTQPGAPPAQAAKAAPVCQRTPLGPPRPPPRPPPAGLIRSKRETRSREVLARHVSRLAASAAGEGCPGGNLEQSVLRFVRDQLEAGPSIGADFWTWTRREDGVKLYSDLIHKYKALYKTDCFSSSHLQDAKVLQLFESSSKSTPPLPDLTVFTEPDNMHSYVHLPVSAIRFAHDRQSETFGRDRDGWKSRGVLQLAVELLNGETSPHSVEAFKVTYYQGQWYFRSGNRRLAAFKLWARAVASTKSVQERIRFRAVPVDPAFTGASGGRAKLSTNNDGHSLRINETNEAVADKGPSFGADLLGLLTPLLQRLSGAGA